MYIIWKYDEFPYKLCGKVLEKKKNGDYTVEGYGGMRFEALRVIKSDEKGKLVKDMLERETRMKRTEQNNLDRRFDEIVAKSLVMILGL